MGNPERTWWYTSSVYVEQYTDGRSHWAGQAVDRDDMSVLSYPRFHLRRFFYVLSATLVAFVIVCYLHSVSSLFWYLLLVLLHRFNMLQVSQLNVDVSEGL